MVYELKVVFKKCTTVLHVDRFGVEKKIRGGGGSGRKHIYHPLAKIPVLGLRS